MDSVHSKGGYIYAQLWHSGRAALSLFTGYEKALSASAMPFDESQMSRYPPPDETGNPGRGECVRLSEYPPMEMTREYIQRTIVDFVAAAKRGVEECGFYGVEVHGGNGYLIEQFLNTDVNKREDEYGGKEGAEGYCRFGIELMSALAEAIGWWRLAIRLTPFGLFNQTRGERRVEIWSCLCRMLKERIPDLSYIHMLEPRFEQIIDVKTKESYLASLKGDISLRPFRTIMGSTMFVTAGGYNDTNVWDIIDSGEYDAVSIGRYFTSNPDLVRRLKEGIPLRKYDRARFYLQPYNERENGYTDHPFAGE